MKALTSILLPFFFAVVACAGEAKPVDPLKPSPEWTPVFSVLSRPKYIRSQFTELRHSRFRSKPTEVRGVMRYSPEHGVSIEHRDGDDITVTLITPKGLYQRSDGRFELVDHDVPAVRAPRMLYPVFNFDRKTLAENFTVAGEATPGGQWHLTLTPKDKEIAGAVARVELDGDKAGITRIVIVRDETTRIEIRIDATEFPEGFQKPETEAYFTGWKK